jgi:hypothetical protein
MHILILIVVFYLIIHALCGRRAHKRGHGIRATISGPLFWGMRWYKRF